MNCSTSSVCSELYSSGLRRTFTTGSTPQNADMTIGTKVSTFSIITGK